MKRLSAILVTAIFVLSLSACGSANSGSADGQQISGTGAVSSQPASSSAPSADAQNNPGLTADEALDIALKQAGVAKDSIRDLENRLERENGILVYEIDFESGNTEYSYEVNAETGDIVERDRDRDD